MNQQARVAMQACGVVGIESFDYFSENGEKQVKLARGERILLRQNDKSIGVRNGDLATIMSINESQFTAKLDKEDGYFFVYCLSIDHF